MTVILFRAVLTAAIAAVALTQLGQGENLVVWELLLALVVIVELRRIPGLDQRADPSLFGSTGDPELRAPRLVAAAEMAALDALSGHVEPDRRLIPRLQRIARHRLRRHGADIDSEKGRRLLGDENRRLLDEGGPLDGESLGGLVSRLEDL